EPSQSASLDEPQRGYADPSDVVTSSPINVAGRTALYDFVTCAGADRVLILDFQKLALYMTKRREKIQAEGTEYSTVPDDLTASRHYVAARLDTQANPRRLALSGDGKTLVVSNYLADSLTVIDTSVPRVVRHVRLGGSEPDAVRRGEMLFNSGKMTFQGQFTCASCHPNGGRDRFNE